MGNIVELAGREIMNQKKKKEWKQQRIKKAFIYIV